MNDLFEKLKKLIVEQLGVEESQITLSAKFCEDLGADSLDQVELVMAAETEFEIEISDEEAESIITVQQALSLLESKLAK